MMTKHDYVQAICLALLAGFTVLTLWAMFITTSQCHAIGGTTVRGLVWLECIK
jgi:hypothetical protein